ncbi:unnamed protein product, partial [Closterium sp. NIES-54]
AAVAVPAAAAAAIAAALLPLPSLQPPCQRACPGSSLPPRRGPFLVAAPCPADAPRPSPTSSGPSLPPLATAAAPAAIANPNVLTFDAEGRAVDIEVWVDDLQLFLQCDSKDGLSLFDLTSGASTAPAADADSTVRSQWTTRDAAACLAVRSHLPSTERVHFSQYKSAKTLYDAVVARYSSPATAALSHLMLPYLFPDLAVFATVADLLTHLRTNDTRYRAALLAEDHFLSVCPTTLTVDLLEERLLAAEKSIVAVGASRGDPRAPFFEGCSPVPLLPSVASAAAVNLVGTKSVGTASAPSGRRRNGKGKGGKGAGGAGGGGSGSVPRLASCRRRRVAEVLELELLRLPVVLLELELLEVLELEVLLEPVLPWVLELALLELLEVLLVLVVLLELKLPLGVLVLSLLVLEALRSRGRTSFRSLSRFLVFRLLLLASPLPAPSPYAGPNGGLTERREPESRPVSPVRSARTSRRVPRPRPPVVPGTHQMALRPSTAPQHVPLPHASPGPSFESTAASALVDELVDFTAHCCIDYAASLVAESESICPPSVGGECALGTDVLEDRQEELQCFDAALPHLVSMLLAPEGDPDALDIPTPRSYAEAIEGPYSSQWQSAMDAEMASWKSTGTYVDEVPPPGANITFSPTPKMTTLRVLLHVAAQCDHELHSLYFSTAFLQGSLHEEIWLRRPPGFTRSFPPGTQRSLRRPVYGLRQAPREWHDTLRTTLATLGFAPSTADPSLFLSTDTLLPPFYILVYVDDLVFATADTAGLAHVNSEL